MFEAVLWDFGGVITSSPFDAFADYEQRHGLPIGAIRQINAINPDDNAWARLERSEIDADAFDRLFAAEARALGWTIPGSDILPLVAGTIRPRMVAAIEHCKTLGLKTGCITNNMPAGHGAGMARTAQGADAVAGVLARFDAVIESAKTGIRKPDPKIYLMMCERLNVRPAACVYLDDLGINCKGAASTGMTAIKVSGEEALDKLGALLGTRFPDAIG